MQVNQSPITQSYIEYTGQYSKEINKIILNQIDPEGIIPISDDLHVKARRISVQLIAYQRKKGFGSVEARICELHILGKNISQIAKEVSGNDTKVNRILASPHGKDYLTLLRIRNSLVGGVSYRQREHMLWSIAVQNQEERPHIAIAALAEINRNTIDSPRHQQDQENLMKKLDALNNDMYGKVINVGFSDPRLKETALDQLPDDLAPKTIDHELE